MRLRKLGHGQSLMFVAPPEVHQSIVESAGEGLNRELSGLDVIAWSLEQSCSNIERCQPLRITQGLLYHQRQVVARNFCEKFPHVKELTAVDMKSDEVTAFREKEEQSLSNLYAPQALKTAARLGIITSSQENPNPMVQSLLKIWAELNQDNPEGATMHEEHEREVAHEVNQETQIERPPGAKALCACVDKKLRRYIQSGDPREFRKFALAFNEVAATSSAAPLIAHIKSVWNHLRVTKGFIDAVERPVSGSYDNYFRPANWALARRYESGATGLLLLSQFEVNELLHDIRHESSEVTLLMYEPRVMKSMSAVDSNTYGQPSVSTERWLNVNPQPRLELHLFAGQLYLDTYDQYRQLCEMVGTARGSTATVPLSFVKEWIGIRRKGQNYLQSHIGQVVSGRVLKEDEFEEELFVR